MGYLTPKPPPWIKLMHTNLDLLEHMAKVEIHKRAGNLYDAVWWRWMPGVTITVKWPKGEVVLDEMPDGSKVSGESADPNDHYRPFLEENVGKQGWDWQWGLRDNNAAENRLTIKFRRKFEAEAAYFALKWN